MDVHIQVDVLQQAIRQVRRAVGTTTGYGEYLLLTASHGTGIALAAYNGTFSIIRWLDEQPQGGTLGQQVDAQTLAALVKTLPTGNFVDLKVHEQATVQENDAGEEFTTLKLWTEISSGNIEASFNGYEEQGFAIALPNAPETGIRLQAGKLRQALEAVIFAADVSSYGSHPVLASVKFEFDTDSLTLVTADGFRLARRVVKLELATVAEPFSALVPVETVRELLYILKDLERQADDDVLFHVNDTGTQAQFLCGPDLLLTTQLVDGNYPDYQRIIPDLNAYPVTITVGRSQLLKAVKRARIFSNLMVRFSCDVDAKHTLTVAAEGAAAGNGETALSVDLAMPEDTFTIAFNPKFFTQLLKAVPADQVTLVFKNANRPGVIYPAAGSWREHIHVIMPMAL